MVVSGAGRSCSECRPGRRSLSCRCSWAKFRRLPGLRRRVDAQAQLASKATSGPSNPTRERDAPAAVDAVGDAATSNAGARHLWSRCLKYFRLWRAERGVLPNSFIYLAIAPEGSQERRLMGRLGAPVSDDTILRHLKRRVADRNATTPVRVAGIDDWSWRKGSTYGAIVVDLERREVVDVLPDRSAAATANWLRGCPEVEVRQSRSVRSVRSRRA